MKYICYIFFSAFILSSLQGKESDRPATSITVTFKTVYNERLRFAVEQLRNDTYQGKSVLVGPQFSYGAMSGSFSLLYPYIAQRAGPDDLRLMLADACPLIRIAAAKRIISGFRPAYFKPQAADFLLQDEEELWVGPTSPAEEGRMMKVKEVITLLKRNPKLFD